MINVGSVWTSDEGVRFRVVDVRNEDGCTWVEYEKFNLDHTYSCFIEAFLHRFREVPDGS